MLYKVCREKHVDFLMFATHIGSIVLPTFFETCKVCSMLYAVIRHVFFPYIHMEAGRARCLFSFRVVGHGPRAVSEIHTTEMDGCL